MRTKRFNISSTSTKVGVMTGGIKENKPQLELNMGDLVKGQNYQEVDGTYHGYRSLPGYEVYDGTALASSISVPIVEDGGNDGRTILLLEPIEATVVDLSREEVSVTTANVSAVTTPLFLDFSYSWELSSGSSISFPNTNFSNKEFCIDISVDFNTIDSDYELYKDGTNFRFYIDKVVDRFKLSINNEAVTAIFSASPSSLSGFNRISLRRIEDKIYFNINGVEDPTSVTLTASYIIDYVAGNSIFSCVGYLSQYRISYDAYRRVYGQFEIIDLPYHDSLYNYVYYNDVAREARRTAITPVGASGASGTVLGCHMVDGYALAVRNNTAGTEGALWKTTGSGWSKVSGSTILSYTSGNKNAGVKMQIGQTVTASGVTGVIVHINTESGSWDLGTASGYIIADVTTGTYTSGTLTASGGGTATYSASIDALEKDGKYQFIDARFDLLHNFQRKKVTFFTSGEYYPSYVDIPNNKIIPILSHDLPDNMVSGFFATCLAEFKNRLWLGYPDGRLIFSNVGNPADFDPTTFSGAIYMEDEIVELSVVTGDVMVVFCKNSIQLVRALSVGDTSSQVVVDYLFSNSTLTSNIGCILNTPQRVFDDLIYIDDRGLTSLEATQKFGDFETKSYSKSIQKTLMTNLPNLVGTFSDKELNQYRIFFSNGFGIIFTFSQIPHKTTASLVKGIKGVTTFRYLVPVSCVCEGAFGSTNGYLYKIDSGTSFNGEEIQTLLTTSYYHYNSPAVFKRFREVAFEGYIPFKLEFGIRANFDYKETSYLQSTVQDELIMSGGLGGVYGEGTYGAIRYGSSENQTSTYYINAYGTSMSLSLETLNKYVEPHTLSSMIVQYSLNGRKM